MSFVGEGVTVCYKSLLFWVGWAGGLLDIIPWNLKMDSFHLHFLFFYVFFGGHGVFFFPHDLWSFEFPFFPLEKVKKKAGRHPSMIIHLELQTTIF